MEITNREQICATIGFGDNGDRTVAEEIARMLDAADVAFLDSEDVETIDGPLWKKTKIFRRCNG